MEIEVHTRERLFSVRPICRLISGLVVLGMGSADASDTQVEEIANTAQSRAESLQPVPISVQALDAKVLEKSGIDVIYRY